MKRKRSNDGYALVSIIVIGAFSMIFLMALATIVTNSTRAVSANKYIESLRNAAETGIDYAVSTYNTSVPSPLDPGTKATSLTTTLAPESPYLQASPANSGAPNITVSITVKEFAATDWANFKKVSSVYSAQLDPNNVNSTDWTHPSSAVQLVNPDGSSIPAGGFRIIESKADNGILSRTIRVILMARLDNPSPNLNSPSSYFNVPMLSNQTLNIQPSGGPLAVHGFDSQAQAVDPLHTVTLQGQASYNAYNLNIQTNQNAVLGASSGNSQSNTGTIYGDVSVANLATNAEVASTQNGVIAGRLITNGAVDSPGSVDFTANTPTPAPTDTVKANADIVANPLGSRSGQNLTPVATNQAVVPGVASAIEVPSTAVPLPSLASIANAVQPTLPNEPPPPPPTLANGTYETQGLTTDGINSTLAIQNNGAAPVKFYVDSTASTNAVNIDTSKLSYNLPNGDARNFQIFYDGSDPVNINVTNTSKPFTGLIYAPNATVNITGNGTFNGAVAAGQLNVTMTGTMKLYTDLAATSGTGGAGAANQAAGLLHESGPTATVYGWQPITWQEFTSGVSF